MQFRPEPNQIHMTYFGSRQSTWSILRFPKSVRARCNPVIYNDVQISWCALSVSCVARPWFSQNVACEITRHFQDFSPAGTARCIRYDLDSWRYPMPLSPSSSETIFWGPTDLDRGPSNSNAVVMVTLIVGVLGSQCPLRCNAKQLWIDDKFVDIDTMVRYRSRVLFLTGAKCRQVFTSRNGSWKYLRYLFSDDGIYSLCFWPPCQEEASSSCNGGGGRFGACIGSLTYK